ncbi:MAG: LemA family protein [Actinomycetota bacterium]|nr:LemA family protein [Actinomycetota bacterium]
MIALVATLAVVALLAVAGVAAYNRFVRQRNLIQESWRQVDVELTRRHDLVPNLVQTVLGYAAHERTVLQAVTDARASAQRAQRDSASGVAGVAAAEGALGGSLGRLFAVAESYPSLQADQNFLALQAQLTETEDRIAAGRRFYNGNVRAYNTRIETFPSSVLAGLFSFRPAGYFQTSDAGERMPVAVDFTSLGAASVPAQAGPPAQTAPVSAAPAGGLPPYEAPGF